MRRTLEFARDFERILVGTARGVRVFDFHAERPEVDLASQDVHAFVSLDKQVWLVAGDPPILSVFDAKANVLGSVPVPDAGKTPRLVAAAGALQASWLGNQIAIITFDRALTATLLPNDIDFALPISSTRSIVANRGRISLRDQESPRWTISLAPFTNVGDAALVLDGKAVAITAGVGPARTIFVIGLRDGAMLHRISIPNAADIRFAPRRSVALVHTNDSHLVLVDLRFGRMLVDHEARQPIAEAAIDPTGRLVVLRLVEAPDEVVHATVADLMAASSPQTARESEVISSVDPVREEPQARSDVERAPEPVDPFDSEGVSLSSTALPPRPEILRASPAQIAALNGRHRDLAIASVTLAIARAWDEGRLAYPQTVGLPFHSEVAGLASGQRGLALDEVMNATRRLEDAALAAIEARRAIEPYVMPLEALCTELGLSATAREVLRLVAAPSMWGEIARLYGILSNDDGRPLVDEHLITEMLAGEIAAEQIASELDLDAPLIRYGIVRARGGKMRPFLPLVVDPVVLKLLRGSGVENELEPGVKIRSTERTFQDLRIPTKVKRAIAHDLARASAPLRIAIRGRVGSGRHTLLAAIVARSGYGLGVVDAGAIVRDPRVRMSELAMALERAQIAGLVPCVDGLELIASEDVATRDQVREVLRRHPGPLAIRMSWESQPPIDPGYVAIDLPTLSLSDRLVSWERTLHTHQLHVRELGELGDRYAVGPGVIERVAAEVGAGLRVEGGDRELDAGQRLEVGIRQHLESRLGTTANRVARLSSWAQVILPADIQDSLTELIARIKHRRIVFDQWGFDRVMSTSRGVTALFQGGPGTGKTLVASAIANELGMDLYRVDLSRIVSKWIGETEQNLAKLFDAAEDGNAIILFDEADSLFAKRTEVKSSVDRYANLEVNYLLQRFDTFEGIAILTTNFGTAIDNAFKRRLSLRLTFPFPDDEMRERLWRAHMPPEVPLAGPLDFGEIARKYRLSGGYIRNSALRAAFLAVEEHAPLSLDHLERAIKAEFREIGKIAESGVLE